MCVAEKVQSMEFLLMLDERRRHPFCQLGALVSVTAHAILVYLGLNHLLSTFFMPIALVIIPPHCVDMTESSNQVRVRDRLGLGKLVRNCPKVRVRDRVRDRVRLPRS